MSNKFDYETHPLDSYPPASNTVADPGVLTVVLDEGPKGGPYTPIDLTGATIETQVTRSRRDLFNPLVPSLVALETNITDAANGVFTYRLPPGQTSIATPGRYSHRVTVQFPDGSRTTYLQGQIQVTPGRQ